MGGSLEQHVNLSPDPKLAVINLARHPPFSLHITPPTLHSTIVVQHVITSRTMFCVVSIVNYRYT